MSAPAAKPGHSDAAVIDVGSNSVRLVLYRIEGRAVWTSFNEKVLAGLGRDIADTGALSQQGMLSALAALRRFASLIRASRPAQVFAVATAAVRDAVDGEAFCRRVRIETGLDLRVLSGEEEARYSALGVLDGAPNSTGLVGDLGGASLELVRLSSGKPGAGVTLPLGPFAMGGGGAPDPAKSRRATARHIEATGENFCADTLTAVGGAWRNLALLHMKISDYPLEIVHQYVISRKDLLQSLRLIAQQSRSSLERMPGLSRRRVESLPHAAAVLETLVDRLAVRQVVFSAYGLREGLIFESMEPKVRRRDPLIEGCAAMGAHRGTAEALGSALQAWIDPLFSVMPPVFGDRDPTLIAAACRLADLGARLHPDHRAEVLFEQVLRAPVPGMDHAERVFLASAIFARHTASRPLPAESLAARLLDPDRRARARALGAAMRLGCDLSGRSPRLLAPARLILRPTTLVLEVEERWVDLLLGEQTLKRATTLAGDLGRELKVRTSGASKSARAAA